MNKWVSSRPHLLVCFPLPPGAPLTTFFFFPFGPLCQHPVSGTNPPDNDGDADVSDGGASEEEEKGDDDKQEEGKEGSQQETGAEQQGGVAGSLGEEAEDREGLEHKEKVRSSYLAFDLKRGRNTWRALGYRRLVREMEPCWCLRGNRESTLEDRHKVWSY